MKRNLKFLAGAVAAVALTAAGLSFAHPGGMGYGMGYGMGPGYGMHGGMGPGYGMHGGMGYGMGRGMGYGMGGWMAGADAEAVVADRLTGLKTELKITAAQEDAWAAFEKQAKEQVVSTQAMHRKMQEDMHGPGSAGKTAADFTALHEAMFKLRQANAEARATAVKGLYAVLTPEQKAIADRDFGGPAYGAGSGCGFGRGMGPGNGAGYGPGYGRGMGGACALN